MHYTPHIFLVFNSVEHLMPDISTFGMSFGGIICSKKSDISYFFKCYGLRLVKAFYTGQKKQFRIFYTHIFRVVNIKFSLSYISFPDFAAS